MSSSVTTSMATDTPPLSEVQRILYTFTAPRKTFTDIRRSARWFVPWLLMCVFSIGFSLTVARQITWERIQETQLRMAPESRRDQLEKLPPEQRDKQMRIGVMITKGIGYGFSIINLIFMVIVALILWGTFSFGAGADVRFGQSLAIVVYASLPGIIKALLAILVMMSGVDPESFIIQNPVGTNLGYYMNFAETPRFLYSLATSVDLITIWMLVLTAIGFTCVSKVKSGTAYAVVFGWWAIATLGGAALAAMFA